MKVLFPLYENPYWRYSYLLTKDEILAFLDRTVDSKLLRKIVHYFGCYAQHFSAIVPSNYPLVQKCLNLLTQTEITLLEVQDLNMEFLQYALDPL